MKRLDNIKFIFVLILLCILCAYCSKKNQDDPKKEEMIKLKIKNVKIDMAIIKQIIEGVYIKENTYLNTAETHKIEDSFIVKNNEIVKLISMGNKIPDDPFASDGGSYHYYYFELQRAYLISSNGPDQDDDLKNVLDPEKMKNNQDIYGLVKFKMYEASNGLLSDGDIMIIGP